MEAEPVPLPGIFLDLPAQVPGNFQALQAACELSVLSKSITPAGKQILVQKPTLNLRKIHSLTFLHQFHSGLYTESSFVLAEGKADWVYFWFVINYSVQAVAARCGWAEKSHFGDHQWVWDWDFWPSVFSGTSWTLEAERRNLGVLGHVRVWSNFEDSPQHAWRGYGWIRKTAWNNQRNDLMIWKCCSVLAKLFNEASH